MMLSPSVMSWNPCPASPHLYNAGFRNPSRVLSASSYSAISPAHSGATADVPPNTTSLPSTRIL